MDSSSGALGSAVNKTLDDLIPIVIKAPADGKTRDEWLDRLWQAMADDGVDYLSPVGDRWGEICGSPEVAGRWVDELVSTLRSCWSDPNPGSYFHGATASLSCLLAAGRYGLSAAVGNSYIARFRSVAKRYPMKDKLQILSDLIATTPGEEGKWFATAKELELYDLALELANRSPCDPKTLTRAAKDYLELEPEFALGSAIAALRWMSEGRGYELTSVDVVEAYERVMDAAAKLNKVDDVNERIRQLGEASDNAAAQFVGKAVQGRKRASV